MTRLGLAAVVLGGVLFVVAVVLAASRTDPGAAQPSSTAVLHRDAVELRSEPPARRPAGADRPRHVARPAHLEIPAAGIGARVIPLGLNPDRSLEVPSDYGETGWWTGGPRPGEPGPAVIVGHVDSTSGPAVFYRVGELRAGDAIVVVGRDGSRVRFAVQRSERYPKASFPTARVYGRTPGPTLRLITCSGDFDQSTGHYVDNTVVYATLA